MSVHAKLTPALAYEMARYFMQQAEGYELPPAPGANPRPALPESASIEFQIGDILYDYVDRLNELTPFDNAHNILGQLLEQINPLIKAHCEKIKHSKDIKREWYERYARP